jgi:hypothetical protein
MKNPMTLGLRRILGMSCLLFCFSMSAAFADSHGIGEKISDFSASITSITYLEDRNVVNLQSDGDIGKYGTVGATAEFMAPVDEKASTGRYSARGTSFRPDGKLVDFTSQGVWSSLGDHRWKVKTIGLSSDGERTLAVGVIELKTMSFKGSVYKLD